jgi:Zn finger protein HypA/HybF involved in hydrogenase expression
MNKNIPPGFVLTDSKVEGIDVYKPAPVVSEITKESVDFVCPQCGATTAFSASDGGLTCSHCGYFEAPLKPVIGKAAEDFEFTVDTMELSTQGWGETRKEVECQNCGARTSIPTENLTHTCPFCGSNKVIQQNASQDIIRPRFLIPFKVEAHTCRVITREWLGSSWMTPDKLKDIGNMALFTGIYLPYWTFDAVTSADWKAEVGHAKTKRYFKDGKWKNESLLNGVGNQDQLDINLMISSFEAQKD